MAYVYEVRHNFNEEPEQITADEIVEESSFTKLLLNGKEVYRVNQHYVITIRRISSSMETDSTTTDS